MKTVNPSEVGAHLTLVIMVPAGWSFHETAGPNTWGFV